MKSDSVCLKAHVMDVMNVITWLMVTMLMWKGGALCCNLIGGQTHTLTLTHAH